MLLKMPTGDSHAVPSAHAAPSVAAAGDSQFGTAALPAPPAPPGPAGGLWDGRLARGGAGEEHGGVSRGSGGSYLQGTCSLDRCVCVHVCVCVRLAPSCARMGQAEAGQVCTQVGGAGGRHGGSPA